MMMMMMMMMMIVIMTIMMMMMGDPQLADSVDEADNGRNLRKFSEPKKISGTQDALRNPSPSTPRRTKSLIHQPTTKP